MKAPIIINENGDVSFFASVEVAASYMEPVDVRNREYEIYDAEGNMVNVVPIGPVVTLIGIQEANAMGGQLRPILQDFFNRIGVDSDWTESATLEQLVLLGVSEYINT